MTTGDGAPCSDESRRGGVLASGCFACIGWAAVEIKRADVALPGLAQMIIPVAARTQEGAQALLDAIKCRAFQAEAIAWPLKRCARPSPWAAAWLLACLQAHHQAPSCRAAMGPCCACCLSHPASRTVLRVGWALQAGEPPERGRGQAGLPRHHLQQRGQVGARQDGPRAAHLVRLLRCAAPLPPFCPGCGPPAHDLPVVGFLCSHARSTETCEPCSCCRRHCCL